MPIAAVNGIRLNFDEFGSGPPIILLAGSATRGRVWVLHQVPALTAAGYRVITVDNRGVPPSDVCQDGFTIDDMVADTAGLIEFLGIEPCRIVGTSLGAIITQELLLAYPDLITEAVLIATRGRTDALRAAMSAAEAELAHSGITPPPAYMAVIRALENLSPSTQNDDVKAQDWLDIFELSPRDPAVIKSHVGLDDIGNRLEEYRKIKARCLVVGFANDLIVPPHLCREIAEHVPECSYEEIAGCGHYGYLEAPDKVNSAIISFFSGPG